MRQCAIVTVALLLAVANVDAQSAPRRTNASPEGVVAEFYAWYVPMALRDPGPALRAIQERRALFSPQLVRALRADFAATAQGGEEIDGLDADPFLNTQDPCERYQPIRTRRDGETYLVDVLGTGGCAAHHEPDVIVRVAASDGRFVITNVLFSRRPGDDLLSLLREMAARRRRTASERW